MLQGEQLVPAYVQRALQAYPHTTPLQGLAAGLDTVARTLPVGSSLMLLCTQWLSQRIQQLVHAELQKGPALELAKLLAHLLTVVDLQVAHLTCCHLLHSPLCPLHADVCLKLASGSSELRVKNAGSLQTSAACQCCCWEAPHIPSARCF